MPQKKHTVLVLCLLMFTVGSVVLWQHRYLSRVFLRFESLVYQVTRRVETTVLPETPSVHQVTPLEALVSPEQRLPETSVTPTAQAIPSILQEVPFLSQAPFGEWSDPMFQDGCEEASMIMAMVWVQGNALTPESGKAAIESITQFEIKKFGTFISDTSATDTAQTMRDYYSYAHVTVTPDASMDNIKTSLAEGAVIIAPMNGQLLNNPNFTQPGPLHHMLVIIGYDAKTHEFVANDPGTKQGAGYRYSEETFYQALRDYPTGNDAQAIMDMHKTIIVIKK